MRGVCGGCHGRQVAERGAPANYTDAHDAVSGGDCMYYHTLEDMHGDGTEYTSMLEDGASDAKCADCPADVSNVGGNCHSIHSASVECSICHMQGVVSCFDFVHFDSGTGTWSFVERGPDGCQVLFAEPLTESQLNALK